MNTEQLAALKEVAEKAARPQSLVAYDDFLRSADRFREEFTPVKCLELVNEVRRLRERWNTRFNTLCGNCGKRYLGPRDEHLHGSGVCGDRK